MNVVSQEIRAAERSPARSAQEYFVLFVPAIVMFSIVAFADKLAKDGDVFWHIAAGQWMLDHGAVLHQDPFSYTFAGASWNPHEWLSEIVMAIVYHGAGWGALYLTVAVCFGATAFLLSRTLLKYLDPVPALFVCLFTLGDIKPWVQLRPHIFVLPILVLWTTELLAARGQNRAPRWFLLPLMLLWANLHASFLFGIALIGPFALEAVWEASAEMRLRTAQQWGAILAGALLVTLVNPAGFSGLLFPLMFSGTPVTALIGEWQASPFNEWKPFEVSFLVALLVFLFAGVKVPLMRLI